MKFRLPSWESSNLGGRVRHHARQCRAECHTLDRSAASCAAKVTRLIAAGLMITAEVMAMGALMLVTARFRA